jgi:DNA-binding PucR family transcriptional regulator
MRGPKSVVRYPDVALLASLLQDEALATSLRRRYLAPLANTRDGGETLRLTLRASFLAGCNASSAAAALGVKRHTVTNRIRAIENRLGLSLGAYAAEVELVLRLESLSQPKFSVSQPKSWGINK